VSRLTRTLAVVPLLVALSAAALTAPASAEPRHGSVRDLPGPAVLPLVTGSQPEGISAGPGATFFAGARSDGAVYVGDVRRAGLRRLVPGRAGEVAVGLLYDRATGRLWVAGGATGDIKAYDARSGRLLFEANTGTGRFLNDVAITPEAVYVTDSRTNELLVVPLGRRGRLPQQGTFERLRVTGDYVQPQGFGLNGIRALPTGELIAVSGGVLYVIDPVTGVADRVEVTGEQLTSGDGLVLDGRTLYVVRGYSNPTDPGPDRDSVVELRLNRSFTRAAVIDEFRDATFDTPTTAALIAGDLFVVNGRFETIGTTPSAPVYVTRIDL
jgi:hypothetical protein